MSPPIEIAVRAYDPRRALGDAETPPKSWYTDPRLYELECRGVFHRSWQVVGRVDQVRQPGEYVAFHLAGEPIVAVRGKDDVLRAFYNVCRHHATEVASGPCGKVAALKCPYHGWTYALDGSLKGMPEFDGVCNFDKAANGLIPVRVDTWEHWVFVCLDERVPPLRSFLGTIVPQVGKLRLADLHYAGTRTFDLQCNWKVFVDNYLDGGYHVPHIHKGLGSLLDYSKYTIEPFEHFCLQSSPLTTDTAEAQTAAVRGGDRAFYYWIYPNFMFNWYEGYLDTNHVIPLGLDRCRVVFDFFFADSGDPAKTAQSIAVADRIQQEDIDVCESVQRGLSSRAYETGRLSVRREAGEQLFHRLLHAQLLAELGRD